MTINSPDKILTPNQNKPESKAESNRQNGKKSPGPKTARGKNHSRRNSLKHGVYSRELFIPPGDEPEYQQTRSQLEAQFKPGNALERIGFDRFVVANWHFKQAVRQVQRQFAQQLQDENGAAPRDETLDGEPVLKGWWGRSRSDVRAGIRGLENVMQEFQATGQFRKETKEWLSTAFGPSFVAMCGHWTPMRPASIQLANCLVAHEENFGSPTGNTIQSLLHRGEPTTKVVIDPQQGRQLVGKLLEERRNFMKEQLALVSNMLREEGKMQVDFNFRFLADAARELRRALDWFLYLRDIEL